MYTYKDILVQKRRVSYLFFGMIIFFSLIFAKLFYFQILKHSYYATLASSQHWVRSVLEAKRGKIYVKDYFSGELYPVATNKSMSMVYAVPVEIGDREATSEKLASVLDMEKEEIIKLFGSSEYYVPLKHKLTDDEIRKVKELSLSGIVLTDEQWRFWPESSLLSQVLGFVDDEKNGKYGIEEYYNEQLKGKSGLLKAETDTQGIEIPFGENILTPPKDGDSLVLTINRDMQARAEQILKEAVEKHKADGGNIIVMDPNSGTVIAMANIPSYDPNEYGEVKDYNLFKNPSVSSEYEPGSIFKIITMAAGLDSGKITPDTTFYDEGSLEISGHVIKNSDKKAHGTQTMTEVLEKSLNLGTVFILDQIGKNTFYKYIQDFGFGLRTGTESSNEASGSIKSPEEVRDHTYATMTFGQSLTVTPIQMIAAASAIANGGKIVQPHFVDSIIHPDGKEEKAEVNVSKQVISEKTAASLTSMMVSAVENGHGYQAKISGYKVAGKTGTAQVPIPGGYDPQKTIGSFIGFAPAEEPKFIVFAKIDVPKDVVWAESTAAPVVGRMLDELLKYYRIPPVKP